MVGAIKGVELGRGVVLDVGRAISKSMRWSWEGVWSWMLGVQSVNQRGGAIIYELLHISTKEEDKEIL